MSKHCVLTRACITIANPTAKAEYVKRRQFGHNDHPVSETHTRKLFYVLNVSNYPNQSVFVCNIKIRSFYALELRAIQKDQIPFPEYHI
jgi:hypothetical protein